MYYDKNRRYFENKKFVMYTGFVLIIAAFVLFYIWPVDEDNISYIPIVFLVVLGTGCFMFFRERMRRSSERDIDEDIERELAGFDEKAYFDLDLYGRELPYINPLLMQFYVYYDTPYIRRDKEGVYRTDRYERCRVYFTEDSVFTASRTVRLVEEGVDDEYKEIKYKDIVRASIDRAQRIYTIGKRKVTVNYYDLNIYGENGVLFSSQCRNDYTVECAVEDINKSAEKHRK